VGVALPERGEALEIGKGRVLREGAQAAILSYGARLHDALAAADRLEAEGVSTSAGEVASYLYHITNSLLDVYPKNQN